jgi:hypothetical protein
MTLSPLTFRSPVLSTTQNPFLQTTNLNSACSLEKMLSVSPAPRAKLHLAIHSATSAQQVHLKLTYQPVLIRFCFQIHNTRLQALRPFAPAASVKLATRTSACGQTKAATAHALPAATAPTTPTPPSTASVFAKSAISPSSIQSVVADC